jgi:hypothetical protein
MSVILALFSFPFATALLVSTRSKQKIVEEEEEEWKNALRSGIQGQIKYFSETA